MVALVHSSISFATASLSLRSYNKYNALNKKRPRCKDNLGMDDNNLNKFQPLKGLKILELSRVLAGPWAAQLLADLGGDVVKIEAPKGDETRSWGPPFNSSNNSCYFESTNRGKKSVIADFSNQEDLEMVKTLASRADVIIENFKVGGLKKFGLDYSTIKNSNPKIIYCSVTGFGQTGPYANRPGYDFVIQAMGGIMDLTGETDSEPQKPGVAYADIFTGLYAVIAIQSALIARENFSKLGTYIDMSLFDTQLAVLANQGASFLETGISPRRMGNSHPVIVPYQKFETKDGAIIIACGNDQQFKNLCVALDLMLHKDLRFSCNSSRVRNRNSLINILSKKIRKASKQVLLSKLEASLVPSGPINTVGEALCDKQSIHRKIFKMVEGIPLVRNPIMFDSLSIKYKHSAPKLGQHTSEIRTQLAKDKFWKKKSEI
jgi:crotonobetainyl-CoA:carnitine CoA-transferase CaiB-like acyl-CoA transferase